MVSTRQVDPALQELIETVPKGEAVEAILRLRDPQNPPADVRIISQFGEIATCRVVVDKIMDVRDSVKSMKAPRFINWEPPLEIEEQEDVRPNDTLDDGYRSARQFQGQGVVIGVCDWGCDFTHPNFRTEDGKTRLLALWDQTSEEPSKRPNPYGYGVIHLQEDINKALQQDDPFSALGYHPAKGSPRGMPAHGTHVMDIAAGNGRVGMQGVAPKADLVFVHLGTKHIRGLVNLGDSVRLLEALDFVAKTAGDRSWVANLSCGAKGGSHDGTSLVELGMDELLNEAPGCIICQSAGNYRQARAHADGRLSPGRDRTLTWIVHPADVTSNELEVWYSRKDIFSVSVEVPDGSESYSVALGEKSEIRFAGLEVGRAYHRKKDPNNLDNHIDIFLFKGAPPGRWRVTLHGEDVVDGRFHAWIERDRGNPHNQSRLDEADATMRSTIGTIANGDRPIAVGAFDSHTQERLLAPFSSCGPTRDGLRKPDILAPGVRILAARSAPADNSAHSPLVEKTGTSMAAPHVSGAVALIFEAAPRKLKISETRKIILGSAEKATINGECCGSGYLDIDRAIEAAQKFAGMREPILVEEGELEVPLKSTPNQYPEELNIKIPVSNYSQLGENQLPEELLEPEMEVESVSKVDAKQLIERLAVSGALNPAKLYKAFQSKSGKEELFNLFEAIALPEERPSQPIKAGDILIRVPMGEPTIGHVAVIASPELWRYEELESAGLTPESERLGEYAPVVEGGARPHTREDAFARLIFDSFGRMPYNQMVLRIQEFERYEELYRVEILEQFTDDIDLLDEEVIYEAQPKRRFYRYPGNPKKGYPANPKKMYVDEVRWAEDAISPDYKHLNKPGMSLPFTITAEHIKRLCQLNRFDVSKYQDEVLFGLRGCSIVGGQKYRSDMSPFYEKSAVLIEDTPDHFDFHCVLGVWKRSTGGIGVFNGSTVPNWAYMAKYILSERREKANMLPTGRYIYTVGKHRKTDGCFLLKKDKRLMMVVVRRSQDNLVYETTDFCEKTKPADNIHPPFNSRYAHFSSAGCQTIGKEIRKKNRRYSKKNLFSAFRDLAGLDPNNLLDRYGDEFVYVLFTGREARLVSSLSDDASLTRLRFGSSGEEVKNLQRALRRKNIDGRMGPGTTMAYIEWQKSQYEKAADGIVTPLIAEDLGFSL